MENLLILVWTSILRGITTGIIFYLAVWANKVDIQAYSGTHQLAAWGFKISLFFIAVAMTYFYPYIRDHEKYLREVFKRGS